MPESKSEAENANLVGFDDRYYFSGYWIDLPDRRSRTLRAKELFISTLKRCLCFCPFSRLAFLARALLLVNERRSHDAFCLAEFNCYRLSIIAHRTFKSPLVVIDLVGWLDAR